MILNNRSYWTNLKTRNVTVSVQPGYDKPREVYEVKTVMDIGRAEQTIMLDHKGFVLRGRARSRDFQLPLPLRMDGMHFLYSGNRNKVVRELSHLVVDGGEYSLEQIVPEVVQPGDYLVFRECSRRDGVILIDAMRPIAHKQIKSINKSKYQNAI